ncbi:hypothetical protein BLOT_007674 [Blomia tropicalis]|nr:hypothetical protein BLOT_007674 [Blomia tropicalis]
MSLNNCSKVIELFVSNISLVVESLVEIREFESVEPTELVFVDLLVDFVELIPLVFSPDVTDMLLEELPPSIELPITLDLFPDLGCDCKVEDLIESVCIDIGFVCNGVHKLEIGELAVAVDEFIGNVEITFAFVLFNTG